MPSTYTDNDNDNRDITINNDGVREGKYDNVANDRDPVDTVSKTSGNALRTT